MTRTLPSSRAASHSATYDVLVVGGGHAGVEAAAAAGRAGGRTLLLTQNLDTIGRMSCNPAIGGIGKSHLVREVDALGGIMALASDEAGIQYRVLNERKGPAVRATRAQADRVRYAAAVRRRLEETKNVELFQAEVEDLVLEQGRVVGVLTRLGEIRARAVILTTGTFLGGRLHVGLSSEAGGRMGDAPSNALAERLRALPLRVGRLKTGTPPRIDGRSIDLAALPAQKGLTPPPATSYLGRSAPPLRQVSCYLARTNARTHAIISRFLDQSPMFTGAIEGRGPRYCPSIEDKITRFAERDSHQIFLEPEGLDTHELYPNGISTSLPFEAQVQFVRSMDGFENARILRAGYAVEYDFLDPRDLERSLESRVLPGLFLAGQINGTTGYEEAAAQGLLAGINALRSARGEDAWIPGREESYLGVMVDDLISVGAPEPYRMFTSRAEHRLELREDNADLRLTTSGRALGLIDDARWSVFQAKRAALDAERERLRTTHVEPGSAIGEGIAAKIGKPFTVRETLLGVLRYPTLTYDDLRELGAGAADQDVALQLEVEVRYHPYIDRQRKRNVEVKRRHGATIPKDFDYAAVRGLSNEVRERLSTAQPPDLAAAARLPGITPAALSLLLVHLKRARQARAEVG